MVNFSKTIGQIGVDEAGRGAFAGPLVVASVFINSKKIEKQLKYLPVRDSKTLSERQREAVFEAIKGVNIQFQTCIISVEDINEKGIGWANCEGIKRVILNAKPGFESESQVKVIVDGYFPAKQIEVPGVDIRCQVDADATEFPVILAGIVAKVTRDTLMKQLHTDYAIYCWDKNKGYGTRAHIDAIRENGMCPHHRIQFVNTAFKKMKTSGK